MISAKTYSLVIAIHRLLCILLFVFSITSLDAQPQPVSKNKKALRLYEDGMDKYQQYQSEEALKLFKEAALLDPMFLDALEMIGMIYEDTKQFDSAVFYYERVIALNPDFYPPTYLHLGTSCFSRGWYEKSEQYLNTFLSFSDISAKQRSMAEMHLVKAQFAVEQVKHPVPFLPENMGDSINSQWDEYLPALTVDNRTLIVTVRHPKNPKDTLGAMEEDFYESEWNYLTGTWGKVKRMPEPINSSENEGAQSISPDGRYLFFTACNRPDGFGSCDIYVARKQGNKWGKPFNLWEPVNTAAWESQPSIAADGRTLYFASRRDGGKGGIDLWMSVLQDDKMWSEPVNLGDNINTTGNETTPFIHPDGQTLFFASDGHLGMGKMDLFYVRKQADGTWGKPVNMGYPINTYADEINIMINAKGDKAYFSSNMPGGFGRHDLYTFELYKEARPVPVTYMKGIVFDEQTRKPLEARFQVMKLPTGEVVAEAYSDALSGSFLVSLPVGESYALHVSKDHYLFYSEHFDLSSDTVFSEIHPFVREVPLKPLFKGQQLVLDNIFFKVDSYELLSESDVELNKLVELLQKNPGIKIEISGHTDNTGSEAHNLTLSEQRAKSVYDYLIAHHIDAERLSYAGYGFRKPIDTNDTEAGRQRNRRTEIRIIN